MPGRPSLEMHQSVDLLSTFIVKVEKDILIEKDILPARAVQLKALRSKCIFVSTCHTFIVKIPNTKQL